MKVVKTVALLAAGFLFGMNYIQSAYDTSVLEENVLDSVEQSYRIGCLTAYLDLGKKFDLNGFCDYNAKQHRHDYEELFKNKLWEKKK